MYRFMCSGCNATYHGELERHFFVRASEQLGITPLTRKQVKNLKMPAIIDHILLIGHNVNFEDLTILLNESSKFELQLKEPFLIKRDKSKLNRNISSYLLELFN